MGLRTQLAVWLVALAVSGCGERTEVVVVVDTNLQVPEEIDAVVFDVRGPGGEDQSARADLASATLPVTLGLVHRDGPVVPLGVTVIGTRGGVEVLRREASTAFVPGRTLVLRMDLLAECREVSCSDGESCGPGGCRSVEIDPDALPDWSGTPERFDGSQESPRDAGGADGGRDGGVEIDAGGDPCADCDDGIPCTVESCEADMTCTSTPAHRMCPTGQLCDPSAGGCTAAPTFTDIYAIFDSKCSPCHMTGSFAGGLNLSTREFAHADLVDVTAECGGGANVRVIPYDPRASLLWRKVAAVDLCGARMPNGRSGLPMADIDRIRDWIAAGAADN